MAKRKVEKEKKEEKVEKVRRTDLGLESILDLNSNNVWNMNEEQIAGLWEQERDEEGFSSSEEKLLNTIRLSFDVVHYNPQDERDKDKYEKGGWQTFARVSSRKGCVAIRKKYIKRITDLSYENVKHITAAMLLELIDRNFGSGWDAIPLSIKDIIESSFDVSTTLLPTSRLHVKGGSMERKIAQGYEVLEIEKGSWTEAIFAKKKEPLMKLRCNSDMNYDEEGQVICNAMDDEDEDERDMSRDNEDDDMANDETFYSTYAPEAEVKDETEEGFPIEE